MATFTFELYPRVQKPKWLKKGMKVYCLGEAQQELEVREIDVKGSKAFLYNERGFAHGWESFKKLEQIPK